MRLTQQQADAINARNAPKSLPEAAGWAFAGKESELHRLIEDELKNRRYYYVHSRCDRASTQQAGVVDFIIAKPDGRTLWCEVKIGKNKLSEAQTITRHILLALGHEYALVTSLKQFIEIIQPH